MSDLIQVFDDHTRPPISWLTHGALGCVECGAHPSTLIVMSNDHLTRPRFLIACVECKHEGALGKSIPDAIRLWNKPPGFFAAISQKWVRK